MTTVVWRGSRAQLDATLASLPAVLAGRAPDPLGLSRGLKLRVGVAALSKVQQWFVVKARGGTDPAGLRWPPLKPATIAYGRQGKYRRFGPGEKTALKTAAGLSPGKNRFGVGGNPGLLTGDQTKRWRQVFAQRLGWMLSKGLSRKAAMAAAGAMAWATLKREGAKTMLMVYGSRTVEILRSTGVLLNSLEPGVDDRPSGAEGQVFELEPNAVVLGSRVPYARAHHEGVPSRKLPQRRLWPEPSAWPQAAWDDVANAGMTGVARAAELLIRRGP